MDGDMGNWDLLSGPMGLRKVQSNWSREAVVGHMIREEMANMEGRKAREMTSKEEQKMCFVTEVDENHRR